MKAMNLMKAASAILVAFAAAHASAHGSDRGHSQGHGHHKHDRKCGHQVRCTFDVDRTVSGPADYHATYASITNTNVTIEDFRLRLNDGTVINVDTAPIAVNLQNLTGLGAGLPLNLTGVTLPSPEVKVVEIETTVVDRGNAEILLSGRPSCDLAVPKRLNFYTTAPQPVTADAYLVKVAFSPLASIQLDNVTETTRRICNGEVTETNTTSTLRCSLANKRQAITTIIRVADEF